MPYSSYRVWAQNALRRNESRRDVEYYDVGIHALAKNNISNRFEVANEVIALRLGHANVCNATFRPP
jgi:hypothetical protein